MNHEPIQFLPSAPFWKAAEARNRRATRLFCLGIVAGSLATLHLGMAVLLIVGNPAVSLVLARGAVGVVAAEARECV